MEAHLKGLFLKAMEDKQVSFDKRHNKRKRGSQYLNAEAEASNVDQAK